MIHLHTEQHWKITFINDAERFFKALHLFVPHGATLYFEGHQPSQEFSEMLREHISITQPHEAYGAIPALAIHVEFNQQLVDDLVSFHRERLAIPFDHVHCYVDDNMLFWFHDAFTGGDLIVSQRVTEKQLHGFCMKLAPQLSYESPIV